MGSVRESLSRMMGLGPALKNALYMYLLGLLAMICHASPLVRRQDNDSGGDKGTQLEEDAGEKITAQTVIAGIVLIITGLIFCFFGRRKYRLTLFIVGFYIGAIVSYIILTNAEPDDGYGGKANKTIYLVVTIGIGLLVGLCFACCSTIAIWLLGGLAGYALALFILAWGDGGTIKSRTGRIILFVVLIVAGVLVAIIFKTATVIFFTAFIGAFSIILGIDMFARTGFAKATRAFVDGNHDVVYHAETKVYIMLVAVAVLFVIGAIVQWRYHRGTVFGPQRGSVQPSEGKPKRWWEKRWRNKNQHSGGQN